MELDFLKHGTVLYLKSDENGPNDVSHDGKTYYRHLDRLYIPDEPSKLTRQNIIDISEMRIIMAKYIIDRNYTQRILKELYEKCTKGKSDFNFFDLGCGDGNLFEYLKTIPENNIPKRLFGVDILSSAIELSSKKFEILCNGSSFLLSDNNELPFDTNYFDSGIANFVLHFNFPKVEIKEMHRVFKPDGVFAYNDYLFKKYPLHYMDTKRMFQDVGFFVQEFIISVPQIRDNKRIYKEQAIVCCTKM